MFVDSHISKSSLPNFSGPSHPCWTSKWALEWSVILDTWETHKALFARMDRPWQRSIFENGKWAIQAHVEEGGPRPRLHFHRSTRIAQHSIARSITSKSPATWLVVRTSQLLCNSYALGNALGPRLCNVILIKNTLQRDPSYSLCIVFLHR